jgi:hypothetical protein
LDSYQDHPVVDMTGQHSYGFIKSFYTMQLPMGCKR